MNNEEYSSSIKLRDMQISFGGPKEFVEEMVARFSNPREWARRVMQETPSAPTEMGRTEARGRALITKKQPRGHHEIISVLAFALVESGILVFGEAEIRGAYIEAGVRPPKVMAQALRDAKNKYEYIEAAGKRGQYRLSAHGDNLVRFDLPRAGGD